jgi:diaminopimelate decarboxylase
MKKTANLLINKKINIEHVDLGGGFGVNYDKDSDDLDLNELGILIKSTYYDASYKISFEPGRFLVAKSGILISRILTTKENGGINFLITDAGMHTLIRPAMYGAIHRIQPLKNLNKEKITYTIAGPICESSDILVKNINLPKQEIDNYIAILDVGAYGAVMASNYNSRGMPKEFLIFNDQYSLIRNQESITETIKRDLIPNWLKTN